MGAAPDKLGLLDIHVMVGIDHAGVKTTLRHCQGAPSEEEVDQLRRKVRTKYHTVFVMKTATTLKVNNGHADL